MAIISKGIQLAYKTGEGEFTTLTNLQEIPEIGNSTTRERIDVTTLDDDRKKSVAGLYEENESELTFKFLHEKEQFTTLNGIAESCDWKLTLPDGIIATFKGSPAVKLDSAGVSAAITYTLNISVETEIEFA